MFFLENPLSKEFFSQNLINFKKLDQNQYLVHLDPTISIFNIFYLNEIFAEFSKLGFTSFDEHRHYVYSGREAVHVLPDNIKNIIVEKTKIKAEHEKLKQEKVATAKLIQKDKKKIAADIAKMDKERKSIDKKIKKMINDAIAAENKKNAAKKKAAATASGNTAPVKTAPVSSTKIELTPEGKLSSDSFKANKGQLPWPTEKGYISTGYGDQPHPDYSNIVIHNSGIDITTDSGSSARAVFAGEVSGVQVSQTTNTYTVLVRHGDFFTAYSNLSSVSVSVGNKVSAKQTLGKIKTNAKGNSVLKFVINQNTTVLNPKSWLKPR